MPYTPLSLRPFIGAKDYNESRSFYRDMGFTETIIDPSMSVFTMNQFSFYLQNAYVKDWVNNTMLFLEVDDADKCLEHIQSLNLTDKYASVRIHPVRQEQWGREFFVHDPCNILWHIGHFNKS